MWVSKVNRTSDKMSGLFLLWTPIKRNPYFQLEKQNSKFLVTEKELLPKGFLNSISFQNNYGYFLENQQNNNTQSTNSTTSDKGELFNIIGDIKNKGFGNVITEIKEKQKEITQLLNRNKIKEQSEAGKSHVTKNDLILEHPNYSFLTKCWIHLIPFLPRSWLLKPNESYRIVSLIDSFEPNQVSVSSSYDDIENHWNQLESEILNSLKVLPTTKEKQFRLDTFLNMKLHTFPTRQSPPSSSSKNIINNLKSDVNIVS
ncbi:hypothetical protein DICPUDRAFT_91197 [Dictyostelium purpureum]|uniref:Uncharacterized protein n=1 Tax=Dictyostelium purpureum TaxID=5786 RepID=F0Z8Y6_DICPU|nr:uncharacterized protein DICPUDRAFT_91197 [Dictyostelium purpureum]EGC39564.1 hypothetical protein DICPUDRAFT_91197 [Dictyostelium purpureum]|eukprot:XP_003283899.1 hypothetical protein DICPUDRAFT_91197 [Dictyostelium purpureum]